MFEPARSDAELLLLETATQYEVDARGRFTGDRYRWPQVAIAVARDGLGVRFGSDVDDHLAARIEAIVADSASGAEPAAPPHAVHACRSLLASAGEVEVRSGPGFLLPHGFPEWPIADGELVRSHHVAADQLDRLDRLRPAEWEADEWADLLAGRLGPWAVILAGDGDGRVAALCHAARWTPVGAEAGVRTHEDFQRRGLAPAVTAAWAASPELRDRTLFYSTSSDNRASQRVAAKLGLRPLGTIWTLTVATRAR